MNNQQVLNQIVNNNEKQAFKSMYTDLESGKAILNPEQLGRFLRAAELQDPILANASFELMNTPRKELNRVGIEGRVLQDGYKSGTEESAHEINGDITAAKVNAGANELDVRKLRAMCEIYDDEKEDNIEKEFFEQTLLDMMGEAIGHDLSFVNLFSDTSLSGANKMLTRRDGWLKLAGTQLKSKGVDSAGGQIDIANGITEIFDKMIYSLPSKFRDRTKLCFYVPFEIEDAYQNYIAKRNTTLGDVNITGKDQLTYKKIPLIYSPGLDAEDGRKLDNTVSCLLTQPQNMAYGVYRNLTVEPYRQPQYELTQYYYGIRMDCDYYFRDAAVTAKVTLDEAKALPAASKV